MQACQSPTNPTNSKLRINHLAILYLNRIHGQRKLIKHEFLDEMKQEQWPWLLEVRRGDDFKVNLTTRI